MWEVCVCDWISKTDWLKHWGNCVLCTVYLLYYSHTRQSDRQGSLLMTSQSSIQLSKLTRVTHTVTPAAPLTHHSFIIFVQYLSIKHHRCAPVCLTWTISQTQNLRLMCHLELTDAPGLFTNIISTVWQLIVMNYIYSVISDCVAKSMYCLK